jgi:hypothetical protein
LAHDRYFGSMNLRGLFPAWFVRDALVPFLATRIALIIIGFIALRVLHVPSNRHGAWQIEANGEGRRAVASDAFITDAPLINMFARWDSAWHGSIANKGYSFAPGKQTSSGYFPVYAYLSRAVSYLLGGPTRLHIFYAGLLVSNAALLTAVGLLISLVRLDYDHATAARSAWYLLIFPSTFSLSAFYAEGLFTMLIIASVFLARRERWWAAGLVGGIAACTRFNGFLVVLPVAWEYARSRGWNWRNVRADVLWLLLIPSGLLAFAAVLWYQVGEPFAYLEAQAAHQRRIGFPWDAFVPFFHGEWAPIGAENSLLDLGFTIFLLTVAAATWRWTRPGYAIFVTATLLMIFSTGLLSGIIRHSIPLFPLFIVLAVAGRSGTFDKCYGFASAALAGLCFAMFATWHWIA